MSASGRDRAYEFLKNTVLTDPSAQGQFISEQEVADRIGVSRTPIREALLMLAAEELLQLVPKRGAYVAPLGGKELRELIELRGLLERFAAQRALAAQTVPIEDLRAVLAAQARLRGEDQARQFIELDTQFHTLLVRAAGNDMLTRTYEMLQARQIRAGLLALYHGQGRQDSVLGEHQAIVDALDGGAVDDALAAIDNHLDTTLRIQLTG